MLGLWPNGKCFVRVFSGCRSCGFCPSLPQVLATEQRFPYNDGMQLPLEVPVMTLPSATLFPQALLPLYIFEPRYRKMLADALKGPRMFSVAMQKPGRTRETPCPIAGL